MGMALQGRSVEPPEYENHPAKNADQLILVAAESGPDHGRNAILAGIKLAWIGDRATKGCHFDGILVGCGSQDGLGKPGALAILLIRGNRYRREGAQNRCDCEQFQQGKSGLFALASHGWTV